MPTQTLRQLLGALIVSNASPQTSNLLAAKLIALRELQKNSSNPNFTKLFVSLPPTTKTLYAYLLHGVGASVAFVVFIKLSRFLLTHLP